MARVTNIISTTSLFKAVALAALAATAGLAILNTADRVGAPLPDELPHTGAGSFRAKAVLLARAGSLEPALTAIIEAVRRSPLDRGQLSLLGTLAERAGDTALSQAAFVAAARMGWRDPATQLWALAQALAARQPGVATDRAEALLRAAPDAPGVTAAIAAVTADAETRPMFVRRLATSPFWAARVLSDVSQLDAAALAARLSLVADARARGFAPDRTIVDQSVTQLFARSPSGAWRLWSLFADLEEVTGALPPAASGFAPAPPPFAWSVAPADGLSTALASDGAEGSRLEVEGANPVRAPVAYRLAVAAPGRYSLTWRGSGGANGPDLLAEPACAVPQADLGPAEAIRVAADSWAVAVSVPSRCYVILVRITALSGSDAVRPRWSTGPILERCGEP